MLRHGSEANPCQGRIRHKQRSPHLRRVPSIYSGPHLDLALRRDEEASVFCVWLLFTRVTGRAVIDGELYGLVRVNWDW